VGLPASAAVLDMTRTGSSTRFTSATWAGTCGSSMFRRMTKPRRATASGAGAGSMTAHRTTHLLPASRSAGQDREHPGVLGHRRQGGPDEQKQLRPFLRGERRPGGRDRLILQGEQSHGCDHHKHVRSRSVNKGRPTRMVTSD